MLTVARQLLRQGAADDASSKHNHVSLFHRGQNYYRGKIPSTKSQYPNTFGAWNVVLGAYLELGAWRLPAPAMMTGGPGVLSEGSNGWRIDCRWAATSPIEQTSL